MTVALQYKDAFMRANPDYKWHDPSRSGASPKSPTKLLPGQSLTQGHHLTRLPPDLGITPGKLAGRQICKIVSYKGRST